MENKEKLQDELQTLEQLMNSPEFWIDKNRAQEVVARYQEVKDLIAGVGKFDRAPATVTIYAGAGGDDSEDFVRILFSMYEAYIKEKGWSSRILHEHSNDHGGYRNLTFEIEGKDVFYELKHENGVHRLVRISPFNANDKRHTSFALVEVVPVVRDVASHMSISPGDLKIEFSKSSGPGGQNVNKRETAVRVVHIPTGISSHVDNERSQEQNRQKAIELVTSRLVTRLEKEKKSEHEGLLISKTTENEWGNQIRSYVLHPYKLVKDHRTNLEIRDIESVLEHGEIQPFIDAMRNL